MRLGMPLGDVSLEVLEGRCRPNTIPAGTYNLRVLFGAVAKSPAEVLAADVLGFVAAQCTSRAANRRLHPVEPVENSTEWRPARWRAACSVR